MFSSSLVSRTTTEAYAYYNSQNNSNKRKRDEHDNDRQDEYNIENILDDIFVLNASSDASDEIDEISNVNESEAENLEKNELNSAEKLLPVLKYLPVPNIFIERHTSEGIALITKCKLIVKHWRVEGFRDPRLCSMEKFYNRVWKPNESELVIPEFGFTSLPTFVNRVNTGPLPIDLVELEDLKELCNLYCISVDKVKAYLRQVKYSEDSIDEFRSLRAIIPFDEANYFRNVVCEGIQKGVPEVFEAIVQQREKACGTLKNPVSVERLQELCKAGYIAQTDLDQYLKMQSGLLQDLAKDQEERQQREAENSIAPSTALRLEEASYGEIQEEGIPQLLPEELQALMTSTDAIINDFIAEVEWRPDFV